jgi:hypothetical protein
VTKRSVISDKTLDNLSQGDRACEGEGELVGRWVRRLGACWDGVARGVGRR